MAHPIEEDNGESKNNSEPKNTMDVDLPLQKTIDKCPKCGDPAMTKKDAQSCKEPDCPLK